MAEKQKAPARLLDHFLNWGGRQDIGFFAPKGGGSYKIGSNSRFLAAKGGAKKSGRLTADVNGRPTAGN